MELVILGTAFALSVGITIVLTPLMGNLAVRRGWLDVPDTERKLHKRPIPAVGGVAIFAGFVAGLAYITAFRDQLPFELPPIPLSLALGLLAMVVTGFYDDIKGLGFKGKFLVQIVVAYGLIHAGYRIDLTNVPFVPDDVYTQALISIPLTLLWIVGTINAVNLIDGLDGLAGGVVLIAFACLAAVFGLHGDLGLTVYAIVVAGALIGFLAYNFSPASVFMGDAGSLFLGCLLAVYTLSGKAHADPMLALLIPVVALGLPLMDTALSIVRRLAGGKSVCAPDSDHIHHRLSRRWPQWQAVLVLYAAATIFGVSAIAMSMLTPLIGFSVFAITVGASGAGLVLLGYLRLKSFRGSEQAVAPAVAEASSSRTVEDVLGNFTAETTPVAISSGDGHAVQDWRPEDVVVAPHDPQSVDAYRRRMQMLARGASESIKARSEMLSRSSVVVAVEGLSVADLDGEAVVLDSNGGRYFGLNEVGARVLHHASQPRQVEDIIRLVMDEYDVAPDQLEQDLMFFLNRLKDEALVQVVEA